MIGRLRRTATVEALNIGILAVVFFVVASVPATTANLVGYGLVALLLLEGSGYWWLKHRQLLSGARCPGAMGTFRVLRAANVVLLLIAVPVIVVELWYRPGAQSWPGLAFAVFAVAEHVNYFHIQLSHQSRADLRRLVRTLRLPKAHLAKDLRRCR